MNHLTVRAAIIFALAALTLGACVDSAAPILTDPQPLFGDRVQFQLYGLRDGAVREPETVSFQWNGGLYARTGGGLRDISAFSAHPFEGDDLIFQSVSVKRPRITEYSVARKLVAGVYLVVPIDEADADEATRTAYCGKKDGAACRIETREQLLAFARATAAQPRDRGGLALRLTPVKSAADKPAAERPSRNRSSADRPPPRRRR